MTEYLRFLREILMRPKHFQSDFSRYNASMVAEAASRGHITCLVNGENTNRWMVTPDGMAFLEGEDAV